MRELDTLLGKTVLTGDGRLWRIQSIEPSTRTEFPVAGSLTRRRLPTEVVIVQILDGGAAADAVPARQRLPLWLVIGALDYGLLEEVH